MKLKNYTEFFSEYSDLKNKVISDFEKILKLSFVEDSVNQNVCFVNLNSELQDEFKQSFTQKNVFDYFYAVLQFTDDQKKEFEDLYPKTTQEFWSLVKQGEQLKK